jgi:signal transduction histidine kinase
MAGWVEIVHPSQREPLLVDLHDCITRRRRFDREFRIVRPIDGAERWVHGVGEVEYGGDGFPLRLVGTVQDITERKRAEEEVFRYARRLIQVEEELRKRIAMELHDDIAQELAALGLNLSLMEGALPQQSRGELRDRLSESRMLTKEVGRRVRNLMTDLRPVQLEEYGLAPSVRGHAEQFTNRTGILVDVLADAEFPRLPVLKEISLFRIVQEALSNVAKHAEASKVLVFMDRGPETLRLSIADDGKGFSPQLVSPPSAGCGWGLANMRERAEMIGGSFRVDSSPGAGTTISVDLREAG